MWRLLCHFFDIFSFTVKITPDTFRPKSPTLQLLKILFLRTYRCKRNIFTLELIIAHAGGWSLWRPFSFNLPFYGISTSNNFNKRRKNEFEDDNKKYAVDIEIQFSIISILRLQVHPSAWELITTLPYSHFW